MLRKVVITVGVVGLFAAVTGAQTGAIETPACNVEFAQFLVDQQVSESRNVEQTDKRLRILVRAARFVWPFDEPVAREYFIEAFKFANDRFREKAFEKKQSSGFVTMDADYRFEVIRAIAQKDSVWARKLIDQVLKEYEHEKDRGPLDRNREIGELLRVAEESVKTHPEFSRALFRRAMQHPLDYHWFWTLYSVARIDKGFADSLYVELLNNYSGSTPRRLLFLSAYPFASERILGPDKYSYGTTLPEFFRPSVDFQRRFISVFLRRSITFGADPEEQTPPHDQSAVREPVYILSVVSEIEPLVVQRFPDLIRLLSEARARASGLLSDPMRKELTDLERRNERIGSSFEKRLRDLEDAETQGRLTDQMIVSLLTRDEKQRTEPQFKQIEPWLDKIKDDSGRAESLNYFWFLRAQRAVKDARIDDAERFTAKIPEVEHRAILLFELAQGQLKDVSDAATVYQTLRNVGRLAEQAETSIEKARVMIALAAQYRPINPIFAMQQLNDAVKVINQLENADLMQATVYRRIEVKDFSFHAAFAMPGGSLETVFNEISKNNFELSLTAAKAIDDKYLRTLAVLAVAQNCVAGKNKTPARKPASVPRRN